VRLWAVEKFKKFRSEGQFVPFGIGIDTVVFPGFDGGAEWAAPPWMRTPESSTSIRMRWPGPALSRQTLAKNSARAIYLSQCSVCHGEKMAGSPPAMPSLIGVSYRLAPAQIALTIKNGKGRMPGFPNLSKIKSLLWSTT